ncbi:helix-turn-helix domain-containing protein [Thermocatellispora tengchongensis]|uniref:helix-turn-helix domain-containing protein n=1 Tax=Thermocatellispora tengchongensis TaxID=1073253 RepID=UPI0036278465
MRVLGARWRRTAYAGAVLGLLLRLSALDADAESAVRVIAYFDALVAGHASAAALVQATARLAECPAGLVEAASGRGPRAVPGGPVEEAVPPKGAAVREVGAGAGTVWLEREGPARPLDAIVLERFAAAAAVTLERAAAQVLAGGDPALVELALSAGAGEAERARALRLLGFGPGARLQVLAVAGSGEDGAALAGRLRAAGHHTRTARIDGVVAVLTAAGSEAGGVSSDRCGAPGGWRAGVGPVVASGAGLAESWERARTALRFAGASPGAQVVRWADLGALALIAEHVPDEAIAALPDVRAVRELARRPHGAEALEAVRALCEEGTVRRAAASVHLHHSSLAARIARAEDALGFSLSSPAGRMRAHLALTLAALRPV